MNLCVCVWGGIHFKLVFCFLWIYSQNWNSWIIWQFSFSFFENPPNCFPQWSHQFPISLVVYKDSLLSTSRPAFISGLFDDGLSNMHEVVSHFWFEFAFSLWLVMLTPFLCPCWLFIYLLDSHTGKTNNHRIYEEVSTNLSTNAWWRRKMGSLAEPCTWDMVPFM